MNAVEIEEAVSDLALQPFDREEFPFSFLAAFGNKDTTLKCLRSGNNTSDVPGGVLQRNNIHIAVCEVGNVGETLKALRASLATTKAKAKFILATDRQTLEAEDLSSGETIACAYPDFPNNFGFFLPLAGISTIKEIADRIPCADFDKFQPLFEQVERELIHKIGVTGGKVEARIAGAEKDATYLLADVEVVPTYKLHNSDRTKLENIFHRLFGAAQLDLTIKGRFGHPVKPREWFLVPLHVIDDAVQRIRDGSISNVIYDPSTAKLVDTGV